MSDLLLQPLQTKAPPPRLPSAPLRPFGREDLLDSAEGIENPAKSFKPGDAGHAFAPIHQPGQAAGLRPLKFGDFLQSAALTPPAVPADELHPLEDHAFVPGAQHHAPATQHEKLTEGAEKLVAQTFYGTLLKQMHDSPFKSKMFDGGRGGEVFSELFDQHLADRMAHGAGGKLVRGMVRRLEGPTALEGQAAMEQAAREAKGMSPAMLNASHLPARTAPKPMPSRSQGKGANPYSKVNIHVSPRFGT